MMSRLSLVGLGLFIGSMPAFSANQSGTVSAWIAHTNSSYGPCVQLTPALPGNAYACLPLSNATNLKELTAALLTARTTGQPVLIFWDSEDANGTKIIAQVIL
jgi:hypothetical protein